MQKSYSFYSYQLNKEKFNQIKQIAEHLRDYKNIISQYLYDNLLEDLFFGKISLTSFDKECRNAYGKKGMFYQQVHRDVLVKYKTTIDKIKLKHKKTPLVHVLKFLIKYYKDETDLVWISSNQKYKTIHEYIEKYGERLLKLTKTIQKRFLKKLKPIKYRSLTFTGINQLSNKKHMLELSDLKLTNAIINFNIPKGDLIVIPTHWSSKYHDKLSTYKIGINTMNQSQIGYRCTITDDNRLKFSFTKEVPDEVMADNDLIDIVGVDTNTKNNLFTTSNGDVIHWDDKLIKKLIYHKKRNQEITSTKQKRNLDTSFSKRQIRIENKNKRRALHHVEKKIVELIKKTNSKHLVMEWLEKSGGKNHTVFKINNYEINYNDLFKMLRLFDIKNIIRRIANNYGISVSFVHPEFTSQQCSECNYISKENRKTQEIFKCKNCNHTENADVNASKNIKNRLLSNVLRNNLNILVGKMHYVYYTKDYSHRYVKQIIMKSFANANVGTSKDTFDL